MKIETNGNLLEDISKQDTSAEGRRPKILVNNFMSEDTPDRQRSKSVLFTSNGTKDLQSKFIDKRSNANSKGEDIDLNKSLTRGHVFNGLRVGKRKDSDGNDKKESVQTVSPKTSVSSRASVSSLRRVSVRSTSVVRSGSMSSDSTDDGISVVNSSLSASAWTVFEDHVRNVNVSSDFVTRKSRISFSSSNTFQKTMTDLYGKPEYAIEPEPTKVKTKVGNITNVASRLLATTRRRRKARSEGSIREVKERPTPSKSVVENARRGWRVVRRHVHEMIAEKKGSNANFNWNMLKQTMKGLTDMDRARIDMYKRYGVIPTTRPDGTTVQENTMLSEKARAASAKNLATNLPSSVRLQVSRQSLYSRLSVVRARAS